MLDPTNILKDFYCGRPESGRSSNKNYNSCHESPPRIHPIEELKPYVPQPVSFWDKEFMGLLPQGWLFIVVLIVVMFLTFLSEHLQYKEYDKEPLIMHQIEVTYFNGQKETFDTVDPECWLRSVDATTCIFCNEYFHGKHGRRVKVFGVRSFKYTK